MPTFLRWVNKSKVKVKVNNCLIFWQSLDLNDTILFFISDHGYRYGPIRQTFAGWYEDKLPNFWVYLPPGIRASHPKWADALALNAG